MSEFRGKESVVHELDARTVAEGSKATAGGLRTCGVGEHASEGFFRNRSGQNGLWPARKGGCVAGGNAKSFRWRPKPDKIVGIMATRPKVNVINHDYGNFIELAKVGNMAGWLILTYRFPKNPKITI